MERVIQVPAGFQSYQWTERTAEGTFKTVMSVPAGTPVAKILMEVVDRDRIEVYLAKSGEGKVLLHAIPLGTALTANDSCDFKVKFRASLNELHVVTIITKAGGAPPPSTETAVDGASSEPFGEHTEITEETGSAVDGFKLPALFEVRPSKGRGMGAFATCKIILGERILAELPLVSLRSEVDNGAFEVIVESLPATKKQAFYSLSQCSRHGEGPSVSGIWSSNAYPTPSADGAQVSPIIASVFELASRFNHACHPNCHIAWNVALGKQSVHALRDIAQGEELTVAYIGGDVLGTRTNRQKMLQKKFSFDCACDTCELKGDALAKSDRHQARIAEISALLLKWPSNLVALVEERLALMKVDRMPEVWGKTSMLAAMFYCKDPQSKVSKGRRRALGWARKAAQCTLVALGTDSKEYAWILGHIDALK
ncbi:hypothetical protein CYMTET_35042 [Cymbomonas tetramitiformis]|uniref:SET domain-containing protein n=1 Tax=Cymbomonas tetramitiformis TaxID=36881 RepID=A0AAE0F569_9CHLO|nr:hypothetical protein CYMTET_39867 [Cymbomonas tetramitiformis]KAK3255797.1 hypothetical protein CYMTET_35042 [Cymbomonas tetramitiformis]|eukprot:gene15316-18121_t